MKSKQRLAILIGAVVALLTLLAVVPAFGATGVIRFPDPANAEEEVSWVRQGGTVLIEVTDSDLDVGRSGNATATVPPDPTAGPTVNACVANDTFEHILADDVTILDSTGDGRVNRSDVTVANASQRGLVEVRSVDGSNGIIVLRCAGAGLAAGTAVQLSFDTAGVDNTGDRVRVASDLHPDGIAVTLVETSDQSGTFQATVNLVDEGGSVSQNRPYAIKVNASDTLVVTYTDGAAPDQVTRTQSVSVESTAPTVANASPASGLSTSNNLPTVSGEITDTDSQVDSDSINVIFAFVSGGSGRVATTDRLQPLSADIRAIESGYTIERRVRANVSGFNQQDDHEIYWWIVGEDKAGNQFVSDAMPADGEGNANACMADAFLSMNLRGVTVTSSAAVHGCQGYVIDIDRTSPDLQDAKTGVYWDAGLGSADKTQGNSTDASPTSVDSTSIAVTFNDTLDADTVERTDFEVDGSTPLDANVYDGAPGTVFLTVSELDSDARPKVELVGEISDKAGNAADSGTVDAAEDYIVPSLSLSVSSDATPDAARPVTNGMVTAMLSSDERGTDVTITVRKVGDNGRFEGSGTVVNESGGPTSWSATVNRTTAGLYNLSARARDLNRTVNYGYTGVQDNPADVTADDGTVSQPGIAIADAIVFEVDRGIPDPSYVPAESTDNTNAIISIDFAHEGREYGLDANGRDVAVADQVVTNYDSYGTVTVTAATLDGDDIAGSMTTADDIRFLYKASGLSIGAHTLSITAMDVAGNSKTWDHTFTVTERQNTQIALRPGWNLVSFPGDPADSSIDAVIGSIPVTVVMAYDPSSPSMWLIARRASSSDAFEGTLTHVSSGLGYWVLSDGLESISTLIPRRTGGAATGTPESPPSIRLVKGWNLVPVLDVKGNMGGGAGIAPSDYFGGAGSVTKVYWYDPLEGWVVVDHMSDMADGNSSESLAVGRAYWVFSNAVADIAP